jgi:DNA polymerase-1
MKKLVLIDSNAIIHRAYHALPPGMRNSKGELTNAVYGFTTTLIKVLEDLKPDYISASFDVSKKTFRTEHYADYKANRVAADQELYDQIPRVKELLNVLNIPIYEKENYEADDCIGTITKQMKKSDIEIYIVTGDKDLFQLINGNIFVYSLRRGLSDMAVVDKEFINKEYNLDPEDFIDLKALAGDPSDNIPGVPGIGPKTATDLLIKFDTLDNLYKEIELKAKSLDIKPRILNLLIENKDQAFMSQKLATIHKDVPIDFNLEYCTFGEYDKDKLQAFFEEMGFRSLLKRFGAEERAEVKTEKAKEQAKKDEQLKLL